MSLSLNFKKKLELFTLDVHLQCEDEIIGVMASSGSGKSMTLKCIAGIEQIDEGSIVLNGKELKDVSIQKRNIGYLFQSFALFENMTVYQNIEFTLKAHKIKEKKRIQEQITLFHLEGLENRYPRQLSTGQKQRVALARIFVYPPDVLLLDEPFSSLDSDLKMDVMKELKDILKTIHKPVILVSHDKNEILYFTNTIYTIKEGKYEKIT